MNAAAAFAESTDTRTGVALVGHCGPDSWMLKSMVKRTLPGTEILMINSAKKLSAESARLRVILVNRVLDGDFASESGITLIESLGEDASGGVGLKALLISNFADAQAQAEAAGAAVGFGKSALNSTEAAAKLRAAFGED